MKLISEIIRKKLEFYNEAELNHNYIKAVWHFYSIYTMALIISGQEDKNITKKNMLISNLLSNFNIKAYYRIKAYMKNDYKVINRALEIIEEIKEDSDFYGDYDLPDMIAVSVYD